MTISTADRGALAVEDSRPEIVYLSSADVLVLTAPGETKPKLYRRGDVIPEQSDEHLLALLDSRLIAPIVLAHVTADAWAYLGELPPECIPDDDDDEHEHAPALASSTHSPTPSPLEQFGEYWRHRARVAETELASRVPFWLARGRLKARRHTWFHQNGTRLAGVALIDAQGRIRGHLTTTQSRRLHRDLGRLLSQGSPTTTEGQAS